MDSVLSKKIGRYTVNVYFEKYPENPRKQDNLCTMACFHTKYNLVDPHNFYNDKELLSFINNKDVFSLPLYLYDHIGITISTTPFSCQWDSSQVGYIYVTREQLKKEFLEKRITKKKIFEHLESEVRIYDHYLRGEAYYFSIENIDGEIIDSCVGSGFLEAQFCLQERIESVKDIQEKEIHDHCKKIKNWINNRVPLIYRSPCPIQF